MIKNSSFQLLPEMELFAETYKGHEKAPMKYLYNSDDMKDIIETIAKMTFVCLLQDESRINPDDKTQILKVTMAESAAPYIQRYAAFTAWINPNYTKDDYADIYAGAYSYYFDHVKILMEEFALDGKMWKQGFEGTLFID